MKRVAQVIGIAPEHIEEYERLHAEVWPSVLEVIHRSHVTNYSIHRHETTLFAYFEYVGDDYAADMKAMSDDPEMQRWWAVCVPLLHPLPQRDPDNWWLELPEVFYEP